VSGGLAGPAACPDPARKKSWRIDIKDPLKGELDERPRRRAQSTVYVVNPGSKRGSCGVIAEEKTSC
jgi:hypothetical protein